jgi:multidrug resistance efflux pump
VRELTEYYRQFWLKKDKEIRVGQVVARLDCHDIENVIAADNAAVEGSIQIRKRLMHGGREEERQAAAAETSAAHSVQVQAQLQFDRMSKLQKDGVVSRDDLDRARRDLEVASSTLNAAEQREMLAKATPLKEEVARADADVLAAEEKARVDKARLGKCSITAPLSGTVLRVISKAGETVSTITRTPIISLSDTSQLCVRAEVDERDIGRVSTGQKVQIVVDAYPDKKFYGRVKRIGELMGRKAVRSGDPSEKSDRDVLDVIVELDQTDARLVVGLRVTAQFINSQ